MVNGQYLHRVVLILLLMEYPLGLTLYDIGTFKDLVLILLLMEYPLGLTFKSKTLWPNMWS